MECEFPRINSNKEEIEEIFKNTKTIAVIGLSPNEQKDSNKVARYLKEQGFKIIPIYPKEETILGEKVYRSLLEVPNDIKIDMVDIFRKPAVVKDVVEASIKRGDVKVIWTQIGIVNNEAAEIAKNAGLKVVQSHCTMVEHKNLKS